MLKARSQYLTTRMAVLVIQSAWRGHVARTVAQDIRYTPHSSHTCMTGLLYVVPLRLPFSCMSGRSDPEHLGLSARWFDCSFRSCWFWMVQRE